MNYGFTPSKLDGTELIVDNMVEYQTLEIPLKYDYIKFLPPILDQGSKPICVPCSISSTIEWKKKMDKDNYILSLDWIFDQRADKQAAGMTFKEALSFMKKTGFVSAKQYKEGKKNGSDIEKLGEKIDAYAMLKSPYFMTRSLFLNGPFMIGLPVRDSSRLDFWNGGGMEGGHAVSIVGYNEDGLIFRNSWGGSYGDGGYGNILYDDFGKIYEAWAIIN